MVGCNSQVSLKERFVNYLRRVHECLENDLFYVNTEFEKDEETKKNNYDSTKKALEELEDENIIEIVTLGKRTRIIRIKE